VRSGENGWNSSCVTDTLSVDSADRVWNRPVNRVFGNYLIIQSMPRHSNITFWCSLPGSSTLIRRCVCFFARILTGVRERLHASGAGSSGASFRPSDTRGDGAPVWCAQRLPNAAAWSRANTGNRGRRRNRARHLRALLHRRFRAR
jgi:hypothetical protein